MKKPIQQQKSNTITTRLTRHESEVLKQMSSKYQLKQSELIRLMIRKTATDDNILLSEK
jgi:hypothetical protein